MLHLASGGEPKATDGIVFTICLNMLSIFLPLLNLPSSSSAETRRGCLIFISFHALLGLLRGENTLQNCVIDGIMLDERAALFSLRRKSVTGVLARSGVTFRATAGRAVEVVVSQ